VVLAVAQADLSFQMFMEIRNKLIDNYNELMRMQF
jgi:flagellar hook-basal body complex protein FliE